MPSATGGIANSDLLDLIATTLPNLPSLDFEVALEYQDYPVCNQWFQNEKVQVESGTSIERNIILDTSGNARHVRLYQKTPINVADVHHKITAPWCQVQTYWSIERREMLRNRGKARFIDLLKSRRLGGLPDLPAPLESRAGGTPSVATDDLNPRGVPYWLSMREDGSSGQGFDAYRVRYSASGASSSTTKANIDGSAAANAKWRNYAATYTAINADFVKRMRRAFHATKFTSPVLAKDLRTGPASKFRIYMPLDELVEYEDLTTNANDNIGRDLDPFHGMTTFRRVPIIYTPQLDGVATLGGSETSNTTDPIYAINHAMFYPIVQSGDWMREEGPLSDVEQHNVFTTFIDGSYQFFCKNVRQSGFVMHKAITA